MPKHWKTVVMILLVAEGFVIHWVTSGARLPTERKCVAVRVDDTHCNVYGTVVSSEVCGINKNKTYPSRSDFGDYTQLTAELGTNLVIIKSFLFIYFYFGWILKKT